jgi:arylsulfatase A-like enzyme
VVILACFLCGTANAAEARPNVLFIAVDDLNDWIGCLGGHPQARTPNIDRLAARGTLFTNAHCQAPLCNPSRSSLLTGLRPSSTGICGLSPGIREVERTREHITLPQTFTAAGYHSFTCGKIYHDGSVKGDDRTAEFNTWGPAPGIGKPKTPFVQTPAKHPAMDWGVFPERDEDGGDYQIATAAIEALKAAPADKPFFVACGFRLPHVPCYAPQKYFDLYPAATTELPPVRDDDRADTPRFSWYLHWRLPEPRLKYLKENDQWLPLVRAYLASTSYMDAQVGRVLDALDATGRAGETIVVLWSDHGWHLGEKQITGKNTLWQRPTHVPLVFAGPGVTKGQKCGRPAELLDIFPTLLELAGLPKRDDLEGHSLGPQLRDANAPRPWPAITTHNTGNHGIRTEQWRYIRYADGSEELYDVVNDPHEWANVAAEPRHAAVKAELAAWLPKIDLPPAPNSKSRVLTYDAKTGAVTWEGAPVEPDDPIPELEDGDSEDGGLEDGDCDSQIAVEVPFAPHAVELAPLERTFQAAPALYCGSAPVDAAGFAALAKQGIRTVIRIDGMPPDATLARQAGLRLVHLPVGFSDLPKTVEPVGQALQQLPGPHYVCCMYGSPRAPGVAALALRALHGRTLAEAREFLKLAGIAETYVGIYGSLANFQPPQAFPLRPESDPFPERTAVGPLVGGMVELVSAWDPLRRWKSDGLPTIDEEQAAALRESAVRTTKAFIAVTKLRQSATHGPEFLYTLAEGSQASMSLAQALAAPVPLDEPRRAAILKQIDLVGNTCSRCHRDYRN